MNKSGFTLAGLIVNGPNPNALSPHPSSGNTCRGKLDYANGPEYVFSIERNLSDCATHVETNSTHVTYRNAIQGQQEFYQQALGISRQVNLL